MDKNCQTYCAGAGKTEDACKCAAPPVATDPNNYNANCAPTTCAAAATAETEKPFGGCYYHCKANSANAECNCSVPANAKIDFCLETKVMCRSTPNLTLICSAKIRQTKRMLTVPPGVVRMRTRNAKAVYNTDNADHLFIPHLSNKHKFKV
jgi:hypothetical protein